LEYLQEIGLLEIINKYTAIGMFPLIPRHLSEGKKRNSSRGNTENRL
jgi:hypothetical protein